MLRTAWKATTVVAFALALMLLAGRASARTIGPDAFGYVATDEIPPAFVEDIRYTGTPTSSGAANDAYYLVPIGFTFNFYGQAWTHVWITTNGLITFGSTTNAWANVDLPAFPLNIPVAAILWEDWYVRSNLLRYATLGTETPGQRRFVVQWTDLLTGNTFNGGGITFQATFYEGSGRIVFRYDNTDCHEHLCNNGGSSTVGIRDYNAQSNGRVLQWSYDSPVIVSPTAVQFTICGNGVVDTGEGCDDGNVAGADGCSATCRIEAGSSCTGQPSNCSVCGDGTVGGTEQCDDGNASSSDGCSATCSVEPDYSCAGEPSNCSQCGDGAIGGNEQCDDHDTSNNDGCSATCSVEAGYTCAGQPSNCSICGDGILGGTEECDDDNTGSNDGCSATCSVEAGYTCAGQPSNCSICGDGALGGTEQCDDHNTSSNDCCSATCHLEPSTLGCITSLSTTKNAANSADQFGRQSSVSTVSLTGTALQTRYGATVAVQGGFLLNRSVSLHGDYTVQVSVLVANGSPYALMVDTSLDGHLNVVQEGEGHAHGSFGPLTGTQSGGSLAAGSLDLPGTTSVSNAAAMNASADTPLTRGGSATITGVGTGSPTTHTLTFTWDTTCNSTPTGVLFSSGDECAVRFGLPSQLGSFSAGQYPGSPMRTASDDGHFVSVTLIETCGNEVPEANEACDLGAANGAMDSCCTSNCAVRAASDVCRSALDLCDAPETCATSADGICPADELQPSGFVCRSSTDGECDVAEQCSGVSASCPGDAFVSSGTPCASDGSICTTDQCDGAGMCTHLDNGTCDITSTNLSPGGTVTTDPENDGATPSDPVETAITVPGGGTVSIEERPFTNSPDGFFLYGNEVEIDAPNATAANPLVMAFRLDASVLFPQPFGQAEINVGYPFVFKDAVLVPNCTGAPNVASPDPCIQSRVLQGDGDVIVTVLTSTASLWQFGIPSGECPARADNTCVTGFAKAFLLIKENVPGKQKLVAKLGGGPALDQTDLGNPLSGADGGTGTMVSLCIYAENGDLAGELIASGPTSTCAESAPCWKSIGNAPNDPSGPGKGYAYKDTVASTDGLQKLLYKGGDAGKPKVIVKAKGSTLPLGIPAALQSSAQATLQLRSSDGECLSATVTDIKKQEAGFFKAK